MAKADRLNQSEALWPWEPRQAEATRAADTHRYTLFGGSRGPGKSWWLRRYLLRYLVKAWEIKKLRGVRVMLACEDYPSLQDRHLSKVASEFPTWLGRFNKTTHEYVLAEELGGGVLCFRNLDKPEKYQSAEFAAIGVDELTKNDKSTFDILRGSLRWPGIENVRFVAATNPGGPGHLWVKDLWVDRIYPEELEDQAHEFAFVKALPADNPHLPQSYWEMLNSLPPDLARAWVEGDWDVFEGQVFTEWRRDAHVVEPFTIPENWLRWRAIDWGHSAPFCCVWMARDPDTGRVVVYREAYQSGLTDPEQAELVRDMTNDDERIELTLADPSMWTARTLERQTKSTADVYRENGVSLTRADNDRLTGLRRVRDGLQLLEDGRPGLMVFETCRNLIRTLPALPYDRVRVEDVDTDAEDHAYDALRYGLAWKAKTRKAQDTPDRIDYWARAKNQKRRTKHG